MSASHYSSSDPTPTARAIPRAPQPLGLRRSFGFGDRLGLATPGHVAAARRFSVAPVFVQLAPREIARSGMSAATWLDATTRAAAAAAFTRDWGADANGVKTEADVEHMAAAGLTWFTLDPSAFIENRADVLPPDALAEELAVLGKEGILPPGWITSHVGRRFDLAPDLSLAPDLDSLGRAAVKFSRALHHAQRLARHVSAHARHAPYDLELALVECSTPATPVEHLFVGLEARRRGLPLTALAMRWDAGLEPAAEHAGDVAAFERAMRAHAAIARHSGSYKVSVHHGGDKLAILPALARACGEHLHVKTSATTFLVALRLVVRTAPDLFREIASFARLRFEAERIPHLVSTRPADVDRLFRGPALADLESSFLDTRAGRQLLDAAAGSILQAGLTSRGRPFRDAIMEILLLRRDEHHELLDAVFTRHLQLLNEG
ncbi:MAG: hypothetical protein IAE82_07760 [Opitutaceae bacterium]|nr:hypothetical protein [Opitutaceae bacterium]